MGIRTVLIPFLWVDIDCKTLSYVLRILFVLGIIQFYHIFNAKFRLWKNRNNFSINQCLPGKFNQTVPWL